MIFRLTTIGVPQGLILGPEHSQCILLGWTLTKLFRFADDAKSCVRVNSEKGISISKDMLVVKRLKKEDNVGKR